jgi:hypothetical protein
VLSPPGYLILSSFRGLTVLSLSLSLTHSHTHSHTQKWLNIGFEDDPMVPYNPPAPDVCSLCLLSSLTLSLRPFLHNLLTTYSNTVQRRGASQGARVVRIQQEGGSQVPPGMSFSFPLELQLNNNNVASMLPYPIFLSTTSFLIPVLPLHLTLLLSPPPWFSEQYIRPPHRGVPAARASPGAPRAPLPHGEDAHVAVLLLCELLPSPGPADPRNVSYLHLLSTKRYASPQVHI